ncbi:MAG TPA: hypothetical protein VGB30_00505 [bacterium]|jgi:hypothetical protein
MLWILLVLLLAIFHLALPLVLRILVYIFGLGSIARYGSQWLRDYSSGIPPTFPVITIFIIIFSQFLYALMPVVGFDATTYHLPLVTHILEHGTIAWTPYIFNSAFPKNYEILQAVNMSTGGDAAASMVSVWFSLGSILLLVAIGNRIGKPYLGILAGIALGITPLWFILSQIPNNEVGIAFGILVLILAIVARYPGWIVGLTIAWIAGCKYYGFEFGLIALVVWIWQTRPGKKEIWTAVIVGVITGGFWYLRNIWWFGNPIFPYFNDSLWIFGSPRVFGAQESIWDVYSQFDQFASPTDLIGWLTVPFRIMLDPAPNFIENANTAWKYTGWLAFFWPLAIIPAWKSHRNLTGPFFLTLISVLSWPLLHGIIYLRFLTPMLPMMYFLSFIVISMWLAKIKLQPRQAAAVATIVSLAAVIHLFGPTTDISLAYLPLTSDERDIYLEGNIVGYPIIRELNKVDPPPVVYNLYGEASRHYCHFPLYSSWRGPYSFSVLHQHAGSGTELGEWLEETGIDVFIFNHKREMESGDDIEDVIFSPEFNEIYPLQIFEYYEASVFVRKDYDLILYVPDPE